MLPVRGILLPNGTNVTDGAQLDVSARSFWTPLDRAFTDIRVLHPQAPSNSKSSIKQMYHAHELEKKRAYNSRVLNVEKACFTPLVFSFLYVRRHGQRGKIILQSTSRHNQHEEESEILPCYSLCTA